MQSFNTETDQLRTEIIKQNPHVIIPQETMKWITKDDLNWPGAIILNMEAIKQTKGRRGGVAIIIHPDLEYTELHRDAIGIDFDILKGQALPPEHVELVNLFNTENAIPDEAMDILLSIVADVVTAEITQKTAAQPHSPSQTVEQHTQDNHDSTKNKPTMKKNKNIDNMQGTGRTKRKRRRKKQVDTTPSRDQDFIQAISIRPTNGLVITGAYLGPQTKLDTVSKFVTTTLNRFSDNQVLVGDLNA